MRVLGFTTVLLLLASCEKTQAETTTPDDTVAAAPTKPPAEMLASCVDRLHAVAANRDAPEDDPEGAAVRKECTMVYSRCGNADSAIAFAGGENRAAVLDQIERCREAYCGELEPKPALCAGATAILTGNDASAASRASLEFHEAMLAKDVGGDAAALKASAEKLAQAWTRYGSASMGTLGDAASLGFRVKVTADGFELATESPHKWASAGGGADTSVKLPLVADKKKKPAKDAGPADSARWNYSALSQEAKALKAAFPEESTVTLTVDTQVPSDVQTKTMNALRGDGCKLEADASPAKVPPECLFWRQILR